MMKFNPFKPKPKKPEPQQPTATTEVFRVVVPENIRPGQEFQTYAGSRIVLVRCPPDGYPGQALSITVPKRNSRIENNGGHTEQNQVQPPPPPLPPPSPPPPAPVQSPRPKQQLFEAVVPHGVHPGEPFSLLAGGQRILVTCPSNARAGSRIRFNVPTALLDHRPKIDNEAAKIRMAYNNKDGWARTLRITDMQFQWIRMDDKGDIDLDQRFDIDRSAYVRKLDLRPSPNALRSFTLRLVPAADATVDSSVKGPKGRELVSYADIADAQVLAFEQKAKWFQETCAKYLKVPWNAGHMEINVRNSSLVVDSLNAILTMSRTDMRKHWKFNYIDCPEVIDAGGVTRDWFHQVTEELFNADMGLWQSSAVNQMCMQINPVSAYCCGEGHLAYYRFLGRVMGRALMDRQLISGHMVQHLYKHILGWPITFADLERVDEQYYDNLKKIPDLAKTGEDLSMVLCMDFTTTQEMLGLKEEIELVKGGADMEVNNENYPEYLEACMKYRMLDRVKCQLNELLLGIFDVIPEPLLTIFDFQELELLMCGLPEIDIDDWRANTEYSGELEYTFGEHEVCDWFWEVVYELDRETQARLLQFVTGTSGVPSRGFSCLQGNDGNIRKFTVHGVNQDTCLYPRAHTCFNRIDLPLYDSKEELEEKLKLSVAMAATVFDME